MNLTRRALERLEKVVTQRLAKGVKGRMSKRDELDGRSKPAPKEILSWLFIQNQLADNAAAWAKEDCVDTLVRKLDGSQVAALVGCCADQASYFDNEQLTRVLGALPKEQMLAAVSKEDLQDAMQKFDDGGRAQIAWRSLSKERLQDYLRSRCSQVELASLEGLGLLDRHESGGVAKWHA
jgi:hypothetical protein